MHWEKSVDTVPSPLTIYTLILLCPAFWSLKFSHFSVLVLMAEICHTTMGLVVPRLNRKKSVIALGMGSSVGNNVNQKVLTFQSLACKVWERLIPIISGEWSEIFLGAYTAEKVLVCASAFPRHISIRDRQWYEEEYHEKHCTVGFLTLPTSLKPSSHISLAKEVWPPEIVPPLDCDKTYPTLYPSLCWSLPMPKEGH